MRNNIIVESSRSFTVILLTMLLFSCDSRTPTKSDSSSTASENFNLEISAQPYATDGGGNAVVVGENNILNKEGLRYKDEFVRHKILDSIGDLYLAGYKIIGKIICSQGGHSLTNQLLREVFQNKDNFSIVEIKEKNIPHSLINRKYLRSIA